jgi:8-oxo-dGTP pyrophosphatase MutT (NUDIX family)
MPHINELIDYTVEVFIVHENKVLFRYHDKYNLWMSVGGHIELDEDPNQAAIREVKEEVGLDVVLYDKLKPFSFENDKYKELIPPYFLNIHKVSETHRHVTFNYFATSVSDQVVETSHDKSGKWKWMTKEEIESDDEIHYQKKIYALKALEELGK